MAAKSVGGNTIAAKAAPTKGDELIAEGINGFVRDALDESALADALDRLANNSCAMRQAARATAEALPIEAMSEKLMALYRQIGAPTLVTDAARRP